MRGPPGPLRLSALRPRRNLLRFDRRWSEVPLHPAAATAPSRRPPGPNLTSTGLTQIRLSGFSVELLGQLANFGSALWISPPPPGDPLDLELGLARTAIAQRKRKRRRPPVCRTLGKVRTLRPAVQNGTCGAASFLSQRVPEGRQALRIRHMHGCGGTVWRCKYRRPRGVK